METVFWRRLKQLCDEHNTTPTGVCKATGLSTGSPPVWKRGSIPKQAVREKLAAYFGVSPDFFLAPEEKEKDPAEPAGASEEQIRFALFDGGEISDEGYAKVVEFAKMVQALERQQKLSKKNNE